MLKTAMKNYISIMAIVLATTAMVSCDKDTEGLTQITYYPVFTMDGPTDYVAEAGVPYVDPGCTATLDGEDVTNGIVVKTSMDMQNPKPGFYTIDYSYVNADGIENSVSRNVIVATRDDKASGFYTVNTDSYRDYNGMTYFGGYQMLVIGDGNGNYHISDMLGGWYQYRAGYGSDYALTGDITIGTDGDITLVDSFINGWGDSADSLEDGKYDAATGTISWIVTYVNMPFHISATNDNFE